MTQNEFLQETMRGTGVTMTGAEAMEHFGIQNLRARMTQLRHAGLRVRTTPLNDGTRAVRYAISGRDIHGSRARVDVSDHGSRRNLIYPYTVSR